MWPHAQYNGTNRESQAAPAQNASPEPKTTNWVCTSPQKWRQSRSKQSTTCATTQEKRLFIDWDTQWFITV
jgi:hypothetical protein